MGPWLNLMLPGLKILLNDLYLLCRTEVTPLCLVAYGYDQLNRAGALNCRIHDSSRVAWIYDPGSDISGEKK